MSRTPEDRQHPAFWLDRLERVREGGDRSATLPLVDLLLGGRLGPAEMESVAETLCELEDPRAVPALEGVVFDRGAPVGLREAALAVLDEIPRDDPPVPDIHRWAASRYPLLRVLGLGSAGAAEGDLVADGARHTDPRVRRAAVDAMVTITRTRPLVKQLCAAFRDPDTRVRELACRVALFDEPLPCVRDLLRAAGDVSTSVRWAAYDALAEFPTVSVLLGLADARGSDPGGELAEATLETIADSFAAALETAGTAARARLQRWLGPARWVLESVAPGQPTVEEDDDEVRPGTRAALDLAIAEAVLLDAETPPATVRRLLLGSTWEGAGDRGRALAHRCAESSTWLVRYGSVQALADLEDVPALAALAKDPEPVIARVALARLLRLGSAAGLDAARASLRAPRARSIAGDDALATLVAFAPRETAAAAVIAELSRPDDRDGLFLGAIELAGRLGLDAAVPALLALVNAPVVASVRPHVAALRLLRRMGHPRDRIDLDHLERVDHLEVQAELGEWAFAGTRFR